MRLRATFGSLDAHRRRMGAPLREWRATIGLGRLGDIVYIPHEREIKDLDELQSGNGDTILHQGHRVFLYIREFRVSADTFEHACADPEMLRKFHIVWCQVLQNMKSVGRFERYVVSDRVDEPFGVAMRLGAGEWACGDAELYVCRVCLNHSNWQQFRNSRRARKTDIVKGFSRRRFLETEHTHFAELPTRDDRTTPALGYAADWAQRSSAYRASVGFRCEDCRVDCSGRPALLDTHHQNGVTSDNRINNLRALCKICHAARHPGWYRVAPADSRAIETLRATRHAASTN